MFTSEATNSASEIGLTSHHMLFPVALSYTIPLAEHSCECHATKAISWTVVGVA